MRVGRHQEEMGQEPHRRQELGPDPMLASVQERGRDKFTRTQVSSQKQPSDAAHLTREMEKVQIWGKERMEFWGANALDIRQWESSRHLHELLEPEAAVRPTGRDVLGQWPLHFAQPHRDKINRGLRWV